jgi:hypothetical protein
MLRSGIVNGGKQGPKAFPSPDNGRLAILKVDDTIGIVAQDLPVQHSRGRMEGRALKWMGSSPESSSTSSR